MDKVQHQLFEPVTREGLLENMVRVWLTSLQRYPCLFLISKVPTSDDI